MASGKSRNKQTQERTSWLPGLCGTKTGLSTEKLFLKAVGSQNLRPLGPDGAFRLFRPTLLLPTGGRREGKGLGHSPLAGQWYSQAGEVTHPGVEEMEIGMKPGSHFQGV